MLRGHLRKLAGGLTARAVLEKFAAIQMVDVHFPTTDGRELGFRRYTQPEKDQQILLAQLGWELPDQHPCGSRAREDWSSQRPKHADALVQTFSEVALNSNPFRHLHPLSCDSQANHPLSSRRPSILRSSTARR